MATLLLVDRILMTQNTLWLVIKSNFKVTQYSKVNNVYNWYCRNIKLVFYTLHPKYRKELKEFDSIGKYYEILKILK